jgi:sigma-B regulation protein RsbU (phosphoserine phosphatase)
MNTHYQEAQVKLYPGDTLIYFTDGFTDAANPNGERFEEENLILAFKEACHHCRGPKAILDHLFDKVYGFVGRQSVQGDDMTLIVFQVKAKGAELPVFATG